MERYLIIADDFTGANDTGVQIRRRGIPVSVVFSGGMVTGEDSFVVDTESRSLKGQEAYEKVLRDTKGFALHDFEHVMKKVDSTLRGNIALETKAIDDHFRSELIIFAPALPDLGRTTVNAIHHLKGIPISKTEIARDPKTPVTEDNIQIMMQQAFDEPVLHIATEDIEKGSLKFTGGRIFACDASTNAHMQAIIAAALATGKRILWVGTAAMADNLLGIRSSVAPAMAMVASLSSVSQAQVKYAENQGVQVVQVPVHQLMERSAQPEDFAAKTVALLKAGKDTMLISSASYDHAEYDRAVEAGSKCGFTKEGVAEYTQAAMGRIARQVLEQTSISGLFLTGGDTAIGFFQAVDSLGSSIVTEIAVGIPMMRLRGGPFEGLRIITKAGAFGGEDAIFYSLRKLKEVLA